MLIVLLVFVVGRKEAIASTRVSDDCSILFSHSQFVPAEVCASR